MGEFFLVDGLDSVWSFFERFILAFTHIYDGAMNEKLRSEINIFDYIIVGTSVGFLLYFLKTQFMGFFGNFSKSHREKDHHKRVLHYIETVGNEEDTDTDIDDISVGRR
jgi:hypothetical protein